jgi:peptidoglycan hydrolase-like protein with peptidoglycan-binding domain
VELQKGLQGRGFDPRGVDGIYGRDTVAAVEAFQRDAGNAITGSISDDEWTTLTDREVPDIESRCLQVTASFEGHGYTLIQGNWDGAWLTWGHHRLHVETWRNPEDRARRRGARAGVR